MSKENMEFINDNFFANDRFVVEKTEFKENIFEDYLANLKHNKQYIVSLHELTGNHDEDIPLCVIVAPNTQMMNIVCCRLNELWEENQSLKK